MFIGDVYYFIYLSYFYSTFLQHKIILFYCPSLQLLLQSNFPDLSIICAYTIATKFSEPFYVTETSHYDFLAFLHFPYWGFQPKKVVLYLYMKFTFFITTKNHNLSTLECYHDFFMRQIYLKLCVCTIII